MCNHNVVELSPLKRSLEVYEASTCVEAFLLPVGSLGHGHSNLRVSLRPVGLPFATVDPIKVGEIISLTVEHQTQRYPSHL